jgi:hypothetical protein
MKALNQSRFNLPAIVLAAAAAVAGIGRADDPKPDRLAADRFAVHEWGTFTSFSGSDGVPAHFTPNYTDLPDFVYSQGSPRETKIGRLERDGTISMETPVLYFYSERSLKASVKVEFPRGWITEWYPFANTPPAAGARAPGQSIQWDVQLLPGEQARLPEVRRTDNYYHARDTDSAPLQVEVRGGGDNRYGGARMQREKFLFYRGAATFPLPVSIRAIEGGWVRVANDTSSAVEGLILVNVQGGKVGFKVLAGLAAAESVRSTLPAANGKAGDAADAVTKLLTAAGLYEKEARAMVKTWQSAWFGEPGARLLSLVPRARTDQLLPLTIVPSPAQVTRVLVGRHDFLTPEQESAADRLVQRIRSGPDRAGAEAELRNLGRFAPQARRQAEQRLDGVPSRQ